MSEAEWSQHKKLIDFSKRPGGFSRSLVPNLPYFAVQWDYKGEQGYGHVIEGRDAEDDPDGNVDEGDKGGGQFPSGETSQEVECAALEEACARVSEIRCVGRGD